MATRALRCCQARSAEKPYSACTGTDGATPGDDWKTEHPPVRARNRPSTVQEIAICARMESSPGGTGGGPDTTASRPSANPVGPIRSKDAIFFCLRCTPA